jgi:hypothetical protein
MPGAPKNHGKEWAPEQIDQLKQLAQGNTPTRVMGIKLGRTEEAIRSKAADLDLPLKSVNQSPYNRQKKG